MPRWLARTRSDFPQRFLTRFLNGATLVRRRHVCFIVRTPWPSGVSYGRHVVHGIGGGRQNAAHSCTAVEAIGSPERGKLVAGTALRAYTKSIRAMTGGTNLRIDLRATARIGGTGGLLDA